MHNLAPFREPIAVARFYSQELGNFNSSFVHRGTSRWVDGGLCPFHDDRSKGTFRIHLGTGGFRCFSCGAKGGDIISFTQLKHGMKFFDAYKHVRDMLGGGR